MDRYHGYNKASCALQYGHARLKRDTEQIQKEFPDQNEVAAFVQAMALMLAEAMGLRTLRLPRKEFRRRAARTRQRLIALVHRQAQHPAIWKIQKIFRERPGVYALGLEACDVAAVRLICMMRWKMARRIMF